MSPTDWPKLFQPIRSLVRPYACGLRRDVALAVHIMSAKPDCIEQEYAKPECVKMEYTGKNMLLGWIHIPRVDHGVIIHREKLKKEVKQVALTSKIRLSTLKYNKAAPLQKSRRVSYAGQASGKNQAVQHAARLVDGGVLGLALWCLRSQAIWNQGQETCLGSSRDRSHG